MELRTERAKEEVRRMKGGGHTGRDGDEADEKIKSKKELIGNSLVLLEKGVDPDVVARYIIGSQGAGYAVNLGGGGQQGLTIADVKTIVEMGQRQWRSRPAGHRDIKLAFRKDKGSQAS